MTHRFQHFISFLSRVGALTLVSPLLSQEAKVERSEVNAAPSRFPATAAATNYKCLFNHELLVVAGKKDNSAAYIGSFIDKLKDTDVDAVMCCPTMWRTNVYPSEVDPQWKKFTPQQHSPKFPSFDRMMGYIHGGGIR